MKRPEPKARFREAGPAACRPRHHMSWLLGLGDAPKMPSTARSQAIKSENEKLKKENEALKAALAKGGSPPAFLGSPGVRTPSPMKSSPPPKARTSRSPSPQQAGSSDATDAPPVIIVGDICEVQGLEQRADLNGTKARVVAHDPLKGVWHVILEGESKKVALRTDNLKPPPPKTDQVPGAANRRAQRTARERERKSPPDGAKSKMASPVKPGSAKLKSTRKMTLSEREAATQRLYAQKASQPARPKFEPAPKPAEVDPFDPYSSQVQTRSSRARWPPWPRPTTHVPGGCCDAPPVPSPHARARARAHV